ncbi:O-acetylhomoserine aminocarboxypropyltransferase/cysteine synthase family protein [Microbacterium excoecariae]|uniref:O-acetylhomoserine aminocarboxypropyltransferase/cysteine synthase family protein n=1 Tax=Microbacterium excoecariae TaxID=2715210 RepID=UPI00197C849B|nr:PLP-dependent transferase [Microbacterium excoecariae]NHI17418.1 O-acetylhomoserine aminocarboxypropyltransferase/cysteine synthase [Microbacterium excoecariae]
MTTDGFATTQLHTGYVPGTPQNTVATPIYQSSAYQFSSLAEARELFALRRRGNIYSRNGTPTQAVLEQRITALEGGVGAAAVGSGQAATAVAALALAGRGGHIVAASSLYGGTVDLFDTTLADLGIEVTFVDQDDLAAWRGAVRPTTRLLFAETVANPVAQVLDIRAVADIAHAAGVPLVLDNTVGTPYLIRVRDHGADIVVHSATKFIGGHGTSLGGLVVDLGTFDFAADPAKWPALFEPHWRFGDVALWDAFGRTGALTTLLKSRFVADLGPALSPFNAFQLLEGLETLDLRVGRHAASGLEIARFLADHPAVGRVFHPGLPDNPYAARAAEYYPRGVPSVFAFELADPGADDEAAFARVARVVDALRTIKLVANIGDARTLVCHPASMTHNHMTPDQLAAAGISWATIRISVGLEDTGDLIADLDRALREA